MKSFFSTKITKWGLAIACLILNILFYTWRSEGQSGAEAAWEVSPVLAIMFQAMFLYAIGAFSYFAITNK
jgi:hypothetical protein